MVELGTLILGAVLISTALVASTRVLAQLTFVHSAVFYVANEIHSFTGGTTSFPFDLR